MLDNEIVQWKITIKIINNVQKYYIKMVYYGSCSGPFGDQRAWFSGGERGKIYFYGSCSGSFGKVSCWDGLLPKRDKLSWNH